MEIEFRRCLSFFLSFCCKSVNTNRRDEKCSQNTKFGSLFTDTMDFLLNAYAKCTTVVFNYTKFRCSPVFSRQPKTNFLTGYCFSAAFIAVYFPRVHIRNRRPVVPATKTNGNSSLCIFFKRLRCEKIKMNYYNRNSPPGRHYDTYFFFFRSSSSINGVLRNSKKIVQITKRLFFL